MENPANPEKYSSVRRKTANCKECQAKRKHLNTAVRHSFSIYSQFKHNI
jgi:hypothetical protein